MNTCPKIKQAVYENAGATPMMNVVPTFIMEQIYKNNVDDIILLSGSHVEDFKRIWGEQSCVWDGSDGRFWIWKHELNSMDLYVLTCPSHGTSYEVAADEFSTDSLVELMHFILDLKEQLA